MRFPETVSSSELVSFEPATGRELWRGGIGDPDAAIERARAALAEWSRLPVANRMELMRRFANEVRRQAEPFAEVIARETGKPMWEARTEVEAVIGKV